MENTDDNTAPSQAMLSFFALKFDCFLEATLSQAGQELDLDGPMHAAQFVEGIMITNPPEGGGCAYQNKLHFKAGLELFTKSRQFSPIPKQQL